MLDCRGAPQIRRGFPRFSRPMRSGSRDARRPPGVSPDGMSHGRPGVSPEGTSHGLPRGVILHGLPAGIVPHDSLPGVAAQGGRSRILRRRLALTLAIVIWGCAGVHQAGDAALKPPGGSERMIAQAAPAKGVKNLGVSGVWQGISISNCEIDPADPGRCNAEQRITLTMFQQGSEITGFYKCAFGNQMCRHLNESGVIRNGSMQRSRLMMRVMHEDGSMCFFTGRPDGNSFEGGYECLQGGGIIEQGVFQTQRSY